MEPESPALPSTAPLLPGQGEERVLQLLESITDGFCAFDAEWRFTFLNKAALRILAPHLGGEARVLLGKNIWEFFPDMRGTVVEREYLRAVAEQVAVEFELYYPRWRCWFSVRAFPIEGGGLSAYFRDITEEKKAVETLRASEERYRSLFDSIDEGFCVIEMIWDEQGQACDYRFLEVNPAFEAQTGLQHVIGKTARELLPNIESHWFEVYGHVARSGEPARFNHGSAAMQRWFDVYAFPLGAAEDRRVALLFTDISARRSAEQEIARLSAESRSRLSELETLLDVLPIGIGIATDPECLNIRTNPAFARVLGLSVTANASKTAPDPERPSNFRVFDDEGREVEGNDLPMQVAAIHAKEVRDIEVNVVHEDGRVVRLLEYAAPLFDEHGKVRGSVGAFVDITERRVAEARHLFLVQLDDAVRPLTDPSEIVATAARLLGEHLGADRCAYADIEADEDTMNLTGDYCRGVPSIVGRYTFTEFGSESLRRMRADEPFVVEDTETHQPALEDLGSYRQTMIRAVICVPLHKAGKFVAAMAVHQKVPRRWRPDEVALVRHVANRCWEALERARVTRDLADSEQRFRTLADNIAQLAWMADSEGWIFWYNRRWFDYTGTVAKDMEGWGWKGVMHPEHLDRVVAMWSACLADGRAWEDTFPLRGADGQYRWFLSRAFPIRDDAGKVLRWFGTNTDVTEQRAAADALARAKEAAEAASSAKDDFLAALSHELRTPLTPVLMAAEDLCSDPTLPAELQATLSMMRRNIALEARLIDDLLDLTRIARGKLALREQRCDAHSLIDLALDIVRDDAQAKSLDFEVSLNSARSQLMGDPARLQQVFWNLLKNAVKFTPAGGRICIRSIDAGDHVVVEVSDTGIGIAAESIDRLFHPFEQAGLANNHRFGGLGLGLSISRKIVEMHGGAIRAQSNGPGQGATFIVELPAAKLTADTQPGTGGDPSTTGADLEHHPLRPLRILLVEDHEATLAVLLRLLKRDGHTVYGIGTVEGALGIAGREHFDAVISDIGLPDGSGIDLMHRLRTSHDLRGIALSGYGMEDDLRRSRDAGFVSHLVKPVDFAQLRQALLAFTPPAPAQRP